MRAVLDNPWYINEMQILIRLVLAVALGGLVGFEREQSHHAAGLRTHIMVCLGSCLMMLLSIYGFSQFVDELNVRVDPARLAAAVITGIGFLGAGTILHTGRGVTGLTTAASIWVVSAIGLGVGAGFYFAAAVSTLFVLFTLWALNKLERKFLRRKRERLVIVVAEDRPRLIQRIQDVLQQRSASLRKIELQDDDGGQPDRLVVRLQLQLSKAGAGAALLDDLRELEGIHAVTME